MPELWQAFEDIRKQFGDFRTDVSKNVITAAKSMQGQLGETGLSVWRVMGLAADRLKFFAELAEGLGATMHTVGPEIAESAGHIAAFQKGLGLAGEEMRAMAELSMRTGKTLVETLAETANMSQQLGKEFGMSAKIISRSMGKATKDVKNFGSLTQKQIGANIVFARKLGVEFDKLLGVVDQFDTFEDAAENAAQLAQAFGANVDAFELMNEQDPAKRIESLRMAMRAAGRDAATMSRQELKLLAATTGLDEATTKQVFSLNNQGVSYDSITKKAAEAAEAQKELPIIMKDLAASIERMVKQAQLAKKGFFDTFMEGFTRGVKGWNLWGSHGTKFGKIMWNIRRALIDTRWAGIRVGQAFVKYFPGVSQFFEGLAKFFDPKTWKQTLKKVTDVFEAFFKDLGDPTVSPVDAMKKLFGRLKDAFVSFFGGQSSAGRDMFEGIKKFGGALVKILAGMIPMIGEGIAKLLKGITGFIRDPGSIGAIMPGAEAQEGLMAFFAPLIEALVAFAEVVKPALIEFLTVLWEKSKEVAKDLWSEYGNYVLLIMFGPAVLKGLVAGIATGFAKAVAEGMTK
ncbi:MAG: hypothetical protein IH971_06805, partial [Candidatus Marinimicrobia bacterium]|nr:hypothetical protein [Candidatus Neomarinimicrobiota bacterium]